MRLYPRLLYKGGETKKVFNEAEEMSASSDGWDCARNPEKIALKEANGGGVLREPVEKTEIKTIKKRRRRRTKAEMEADK